MNIAEMHVWFRQFAQQMGMQNVRAILPEQIDVFINTAISDIINETISRNVDTRNDRIVTDNAKLGQVNALRTLYEVRYLPLYRTVTSGVVSDAFMEFHAENRLTGKLSNRYLGDFIAHYYSLTPYKYIIDFSISYKKCIRGYDGEVTPIKLQDEDDDRSDDIDSNSENSNEDSSEDRTKEQFDSSAIETQYFPVRIIDDSYLADTLNDYILKNRIRTPIIVIYNDIASERGTFNPTFDLYVDEFVENRVVGGQIISGYTLEEGLLPYMLRMSLIKQPNVVKYVSDIGGANVDCDLPDSMHIDIVKRAVDLYNISVSGNLHTAQQNQQAQQREIARNEVRPTNEGYQS